MLLKFMFCCRTRKSTSDMIKYFASVMSRPEHTKSKNSHNWLVSLRFKPSQPQRIIFRAEEDFHKEISSLKDPSGGNKTGRTE